MAAPRPAAPRSHDAFVRLFGGAPAKEGRDDGRNGTISEATKDSARAAELQRQRSAIDTIEKTAAYKMRVDAERAANEAARQEAARNPPKPGPGYHEPTAQEALRRTSFSKVFSSPEPKQSRSERAGSISEKATVADSRTLGQEAERARKVEQRASKALEFMQLPHEQRNFRTVPHAA